MMFNKLTMFNKVSRKPAPLEALLTKARGCDLAVVEAFDSEYYLIKNPDVKFAGYHPVTHYMVRGWLESRNPRADFDTRYYLQTHETNGMNPLLHWVRFGRSLDLTTHAPVPGGGLKEEMRLAQYGVGVLQTVRENFSEQFYLAHNSDVAEACVDPFAHYMVDGWREGRDPSPDFSTNYYLQENIDIAVGGINPFVHFVLHGKAEGRSGRHPAAYTDTWHYADCELGINREKYELLKSLFDEDFYLRNNEDVRLAAVDPLFHFLSDGWREKRDPCGGFSIRYYMDENPDIAASNLNPFVHWVLSGRSEGRLGRPVTQNNDNAQFDPSSIDWSRYSDDDVAAIADQFDREFYLRSYPEVLDVGVDPVIHYLLLGWRLNYDPRPDFSTRYYRSRYIDIQQADINPFQHYCLYGSGERRETQSYIEVRAASFEPKVSVIVPNYNHARYLPQRLASIANQTYGNVELIILDDCSTDDSQGVIREAVAGLDIEAHIVINDKNSGNVFAQWRKGISLATGDLIWICESDDFCEPDFLEHLVPAFADESVNIAFGRIQFSDSEGRFMEGLDAYREGAEAGIWRGTCTRPAAEWFNGGFGVNNLYANVGGGVFRRMELPEAIWDEARSFRICGDWFLYLNIAGAGQITYEPKAIAYFRQHGANTSASNFHQRYYYEENVRILRAICGTWDVCLATRQRFLEKVSAQYSHFGLPKILGEFDSVFNIADLLQVKRQKTHVQLFFLGFYPGGGELFPINLANALLRSGFSVSVLALDLSAINEDMRARLDRRIAVYHASHVTARGRGSFFEACGVSVVNSHVAGADAFLYNLSGDPIERPYIVTLHGSYVALENAAPQMIEWIATNCSSWIYTADRNLEFFDEREVDWDGFIKLPNAMPRDVRPAPFTRADLGIGERDTVFTLVARGVKRKGWRASVEAFRALREEKGRCDAHLVLIGEGEEADAARLLAGDLANVHFLGYQSAVNGFFRISDCLILPSRFEGESYPLCLIQATQERLPVIATDIGEIRSMVTDECGEKMGILLQNQRDSRAFFSEITDAMVKMCDAEIRAELRAVAAQMERKYDMEALVESYSGVFDRAIMHYERIKEGSNRF